MPGIGVIYTILNVMHLNSSQPVNKKRPSSGRNTFSLENIKITEHFHRAAFEQPAPEAIVIILASTVTRVTATKLD